MEKQLYLIENQGCDAATYSIQEFTHEELKFFGQLILDLNKNSYYGCMPKIHIYETDWNYFKKISEKELKNTEVWDDEYIDPEYRFWYKNQCYTFLEKYFLYSGEFKEVKLEEVCNEE